MKRKKWATFGCDTTSKVRVQYVWETAFFYPFFLRHIKVPIFRHASKRSWNWCLRHPKTLILLNLWNPGYVHLIACQYPAEHVSLAKLSSMWLDTSETAIILSFEFNCGIFSNMSEKYVWSPKHSPRLMYASDVETPPGYTPHLRSYWNRNF